MTGISDRVVFFTQFVKNPRQLGSVIPSSGFLTRRIIRNARLSAAKVVVELGPGNGGTTRDFLKAMSQDARLLSIELNGGLYELASSVKDPRHIAHHGDASKLPDILQHYGLRAPDVVISGIPFSTMSPTVGTQLLETIYKQLAPGGRFVAYQVNGQVDRLNSFFGDNKTLEIELLNIPPLRVWCWQKPD